MIQFLAMVTKEWTEYTRTYRLFLLLCVFVLFAIMSPATAYFMADILESAGIDPAALADPSLQNPTYLASLEQFFKNVGQMGILVVAIVFAGLTANDISKQTIVPLLAKGLRRDVFVLAKLTAGMLVWSPVYVVSVLIMIGYTAYYFDLPSIAELVLPLFGVYVFGLIVIALLGAGGILFKSQLGALTTTGAVIVIMVIVAALLPQTEAYNPITLTTHGVALLADNYDIQDFVTALWVGLGLIFVSILTSIFAFRKVQF